MLPKSVWLTVVLLCLAITPAFTQEDEASIAKELWLQGKKLEALPLYEDLVQKHPNEKYYYRQLLACLGAKEMQLTDRTEITAIRRREKETAKRAVELGDTAPFVIDWSNIDPEATRELSPPSPAFSTFKEGEKAFQAGDYQAAITKYAQAADTDPKMYEAPLFAGDACMLLKDMKGAEGWFRRAIAVNPDRETAYRYWGDAIGRLGGDPMVAKERFIDALVAEPYSKYAWQGIRQWAQAQKAVIMAPKIDRPAPPVTDPNKPSNITININPDATDDKKHPGGSAWLMYSLIRAGYHGDTFKKEFPNEKEYRHTLKEEDTALAAVVESLDTKKIKPEKLDESLRNLVELNKAGMLDCWILVSGADNGIARDYDSYRKEHRQLLHDYFDKFIVHGGLGAGQ